MLESCHLGCVARIEPLEADDPARSRGGGLLVDEVESLGRQVPAAVRGAEPLDDDLLVPALNRDPPQRVLRIRASPTFSS